MNRIIAFIEGFNLYHAIVNVFKGKYKWLDLHKLIHCFTTSKDDVKEIFYFTAYANWKSDRAERHKIYVRVLELKKVTPVFGAFKDKDRFCPNCREYFGAHEEKETETDVNIRK